MTEFVKVAGVETPIEVAQILNKIINEKGNIDLDNLSEVGEKRFSDLSSSITDVKNSVSSLTTTVNGKIGATVSKAANGYIKFTNGLIIQWGNFDTNVNSTGTVEGTTTLPLAYTNQNYMVLATAKLAGDVINIETISKTNFKYWIADRLLNTQAYGKFYYISVGI